MRHTMQFEITTECEIKTKNNKKKKKKENRKKVLFLKPQKVFKIFQIFV